MAMNWDNVEMVRSAQASAKERFQAASLATQEELQKVLNSEAAKKLTIPRITEIEQMIFRLRSELIDYIVAHGLVDGLIWDGVLQPVQNGKIVITREMVELITEKLGYFTESDVQRFLEEYLPENFYVKDEHYVHTDNNFTDESVAKLDGIEAGAEVNKIIDVIFNGTSVLDDGTRIATITITPADIKRWYEQNPDTNAFTDAAKAKLAGISDGAEVNRVDDVLVDGRSVLADDKKAKITIEDIKKAYEKNPDTNAFTDAEKQHLAELFAWKPTAESEIAENAAGVAEAKQSITELGDEVNTVAGRVTTNEANIKSLQEADATISGNVSNLEARVGVNETNISALQGKWHDLRVENIWDTLAPIDVDVIVADVSFGGTFSIGFSEFDKATASFGTAKTRTKNIPGGRCTFIKGDASDFTCLFDLKGTDENGMLAITYYPPSGAIRSVKMFSTGRMGVPMLAWLESYPKITITNLWGLSVATRT